MGFVGLGVSEGGDNFSDRPHSPTFDTFRRRVFSFTPMHYQMEVTKIGVDTVNKRRMTDCVPTHDARESHKLVLIQETTTKG